MNDLILGILIIIIIVVIFALFIIGIVELHLMINDKSHLILNNSAGDWVFIVIGVVIDIAILYGIIKIVNDNSRP